MMKFFIKSKKGQYDIARKSIFFVFAGVAITIAVLIFVAILANYGNQIVSVPVEYEAKLISLRFVNTPECFTYEDPLTGIVQGGVIDLDKFTQEGLDDCYRSEAVRGYRNFNFGLSLEGFNPVDLDTGGEELLITNNYFNKVDFTLRFPVIVKSGGEEFSSQLLVFVQEGI